MNSFSFKLTPVKSCFFFAEAIDQKIWQLLNTLDKLLEKYEIDATSCTQRFACTIVKNSADNVNNGVGSSTDKIIDGVSR